MYTAIVVKVIIDDKLYSDEFNEVFEGYNFLNMSNPNGQSFASLVAEWSKENSIIINIIISACKYKIVEHKKRRTIFYTNIVAKKRGNRFIRSYS